MENQRDRDEYIDGVQGVIDMIYNENPKNPLVLELGRDICRLKNSSFLEFESIYEKIHRKIFDTLKIIL